MRPVTGVYGSGGNQYLTKGERGGGDIGRRRTWRGGRGAYPRGGKGEGTDSLKGTLSPLSNYHLYGV